MINTKMNPEDITYENLSRALWDTRQDRFGISMEKVSYAIADNFTETEVGELIAELQNRLNKEAFL